MVPHVVIPVLNEAAALPALLAAMPAGYRPIVVDNGSTDDSVSRLTRWARGEYLQMLLIVTTVSVIEMRPIAKHDRAQTSEVR